MSIVIPPTTERSVASITPYAGNPRHNAPTIEAVAESIRRFGFRQPIVVDRNGVIVCGHARFEAAKRLGMTSVPCVGAADLTDDAIRAYRLLDNKLHEKSTWDADALALELADLRYDFGAFGVTFDLPDAFAPLSDDGGNVGAEPAPENADLSEDGAADDMTRSYDLVVHCADETEQRELYERLAAEGRRVRLCNL